MRMADILDAVASGTEIGSGKWSKQRWTIPALIVPAKSTIGVTTSDAERKIYGKHLHQSKRWRLLKTRTTTPEVRIGNKESDMAAGGGIVGIMARASAGGYGADSELIGKLAGVLISAKFDRGVGPFICGTVGQEGPDGLFEGYRICPCYGADYRCTVTYIRNRERHMPVTADDEITSLEERAFWAANALSIPPEAQKVVRDLWREVCRLEQALAQAGDNIELQEAEQRGFVRGLTAQSEIGSRS